MDKRKYIFAGNRFNVLQEMLKLELNVIKIFAVKNSWLEKELIKKNIGYEILPAKEEFVEQVQRITFDFFISNGLPYILPISKLVENTKRKFINIHPSFLPDLRGADPQPGALLFGRDSGATCHYMNDQIDAGAIISQTKIEYSKKFDAGLLYQLSFLAEQDVFKEAWKKDFISIKNQGSVDRLYYSFKTKDLYFDFNDSSHDIIRRIKAFNTPNKMARFLFNSNEILIENAQLIENEFMNYKYQNNSVNEVVVVYESSLVVKKEDGFLNLKMSDGYLENQPSVGDVLS
ncbi:MAG: hypothetical protein D8M58_01505 [Calditrichaeota bacterium]|nr:MAG: hypothetical protein DWQ03_05575 [Calditrichota bacterium]MBL1204045.1 hypothetical protein [Calditrichota bacterium]NOG43876.1 hypothetical protein [Calditrichota bacterium]